VSKCPVTIHWSGLVTRWAAAAARLQRLSVFVECRLDAPSMQSLSVDVYKVSVCLYKIPKPVIIAV